MSHCPHFSMVVFKDFQDGEVVMKRLRCKSWQCDHCAKKNRQEWAKHLRKRLPRVADRWWFVTLTAHENLRTPENSLENIRSNIDRLFKRLRRMYAKIDYVRVFEVHEKGAFHAHLVVAGLSNRVQKHCTKSGVIYWRETVLPRGVGNLSIRTWFRRTCRSFGMGYIVDVQEVREINQVVKYVVKYLTKQAQNFSVRSLRRVQTTQRIGGLRSYGDAGWQAKARVFRTDVPEGKSLYDADRKLQIPVEYWREHLTYPLPGQ